MSPPTFYTFPFGGSKMTFRNFLFEAQNRYSKVRIRTAKRFTAIEKNITCKDEEKLIELGSKVVCGVGSEDPTSPIARKQPIPENDRRNLMVIACEWLPNKLDKLEKKDLPSKILKFRSSNPTLH